MASPHSGRGWAAYSFMLGPLPTMRFDKLKDALPRMEVSRTGENENHPGT